MQTRFFDSLKTRNPWYTLFQKFLVLYRHSHSPHHKSHLVRSCISIGHLLQPSLQGVHQEPTGIARYSQEKKELVLFLSFFIQLNFTQHFIFSLNTKIKIINPFKKYSHKTLLDIEGLVRQAKFLHLCSFPRWRANCWGRGLNRSNCTGERELRCNWRIVLV